MARYNGRANSNPSMPWYGDDFYASPKVRCMAAAEVALYQSMLWECWKQRGLATDSKDLALLAGALRISDDDFKTYWNGVLGTCFEVVDGRLWNPRVLREVEAQEEYKAKKAEAGRRGGAKKAENSSRGKAKRSTTTKPPSRDPGRGKQNVALTSPHLTSPQVVNPPGPPPPGEENPPPEIALVENPDPDLPAPIVAKRKPIREAWQDGRGWITALVDQGEASIRAGEILAEVLVARCSAVTAKSDLGLPNTRTGWLKLAHRIDGSPAIAEQALDRFLTDGGKRFSNYLELVERDPQSGPGAPGRRQEPGSLKSVRDALRPLDLKPHPDELLEDPNQPHPNDINPDEPNQKTTDDPDAA